jgi:hypothetical protein
MGRNSYLWSCLCIEQTDQNDLELKVSIVLVENKPNEINNSTITHRNSHIDILQCLIILFVEEFVFQEEVLPWRHFGRLLKQKRRVWNLHVLYQVFLYNIKPKVRKSKNEKWNEMCNEISRQWNVMRWNDKRILYLDIVYVWLYQSTFYNLIWKKFQL